ncbi:ferrous iron transport protein B [Clostridium sp. CAG:356]|nr:ferrous iron transport protein B [Clostridium sp. CAG:356]
MKIALVGNQNSGKTTLFNLLTGMNAKIGNWPGVTIEKKVGIIKGTEHEIVDLPGIYSLSPYSIEEELSRKFIFEEKPDVIVNIIDSTSLERSLYLTTQLLEMDCKVIIALNMVDLLEKKGFYVDENRLEKILGAKVIKISALKGTGVNYLINEINIYSKNKKQYIFDAKLEQEIQEIENNLKNSTNKRFVAVKMLENDMELEELIATERYDFIERTKKSVILPGKEFIMVDENVSASDKIDKILLNKWLAIPIFIIIMFLVYYLSVGVVGKFTVSLNEKIINLLGSTTNTVLNNIGIANWLNSLIVDGIISGVGSVLSFIPQLIILFTCISILETTGYMSRIALLLDRIFRKIGLSGKSLIPFIIGTGCSVPGIMGTRIIENQDEREMTAILTPFIPCSAKLPIITVFSSYFFKQNSGLVAVSLYFLAIIIIILSALVMKKFIYTNINNTYISELPEYKIPSIKYVTRDVFDKVIAFIKRAGSIILVCSIVIWFLLSFSLKLEYGVNIEDSILASIGKIISWIFSPMLGINSWEVTVSTIQGLIAKEQVISSMSVIMGFSEKTGLNEYFTPLSAYAFMVFNLFSAPCFGAIGAMRKELGSAKKTIRVVCFQIILAWCFATLINQLGINLILIAGMILGLIKIFRITKSSNQKTKKECRGCPYCKDCEQRELAQIKD